MSSAPRPLERPPSAVYLASASPASVSTVGVLRAGTSFPALLGGSVSLRRYAAAAHAWLSAEVADLHAPPSGADASPVDRVHAAAGAYARALRCAGELLPAVLVAVHATVDEATGRLSAAALASAQLEAAQCCRDAFAMR